MPGTGRRSAVVTPRLSDPETDRVVRSVTRELTEIGETAILRGRLFQRVELPDATDTIIRHGLGRRVSLFLSPPYPFAASTGRIIDKRDNVDDAKNSVMLRATGFGATVYVDAWVF